MAALRMAKLRAENSIGYGAGSTQILPLTLTGVDRTRAHNQLQSIPLGHLGVARGTEERMREHTFEIDGVVLKSQKSLVKRHQ